MSQTMMKITDWLGRAGEAKWCITALAANCNASISTLERHFLEVMQQCPRDWLNTERQRRARELLCDNTSVKEVSILLGYKNQHHFSFAFSKHHGYPPSLHWERVKSSGRTPGDRSQNSEFRIQETGAESRMIPCSKQQFDEFKYKDDEFRYINYLAGN